MPASLPALAAHIAEPHRYWPCQSVAQAFLEEPLVPAYRVPLRGAVEARRRRLADAVALLAERLDRLANAFPYWTCFDPAAYFDLRPAQVKAMVRMERLGATLDVTIHADLLSPAFRRAERFWASEFCPAYHAAGRGPDDAFAAHFARRILPAMKRRLDQARAEIAEAGKLLFARGDVTFLMAAAAPDERHRHLQQLPPGDEDLSLLFLQVPSLTLSRSFDLLEMEYQA